MRCKAVLIWLLLAGLAQAQPSWERVREHLNSVPGYTMIYELRGREGDYNFRYSVRAAEPTVFTEILDGSDRGVGTRILYQADKAPDIVVMKTSFLTLRRSISSKDINDTSLYIPLFKQLLGRIQKTEPDAVERSRDTVVYRFDEGEQQHYFSFEEETFTPVGYQLKDKKGLVESMAFRELIWGTAFKFKID